jgi:class 3 adenylate cyclase
VSACRQRRTSWGFYAPALLAKRRFSLDGSALIEELRAYAELDKSRELELDVAALAGDLGRDCHTAVDMFGGVVRQLAGDARLYGEKSPEHPCGGDH